MFKIFIQRMDMPILTTIAIFINNHYSGADALFHQLKFTSVILSVHVHIRSDVIINLCEYNTLVTKYLKTLINFPFLLSLSFAMLNLTFVLKFNRYTKKLKNTSNQQNNSNKTISRRLTRKVDSSIINLRKQYRHFIFIGTRTLP